MVGTEKSLNVAIEFIGAEDLQLILQQKLGEGLTVLKLSTSSLLSPGENFACSIYGIHAVVKRSETEPQEKLELVAKVFPWAQNVRDIFDFSLCFKKEIFFYEKLLPTYKQLQIDYKIKDEIFDLGPKIFGTRFSRKLDAKDVDDGVLILMENLKSSGYYTLNKIEGLDLTHARFTIKGLAKFHALSIACKRHKPEFFKTEVLKHTESIMPRNQFEIDKVTEFIYNMLLKDPRITKYAHLVKEKMMSKRIDLYGDREGKEPWLSIVHFDFWTNNILYRKNTQGVLDSMKIIDFQNYSYNSPLRDLMYFLCTSTSHEVMTQHLDELLDLYYETFIEFLEQLQCEVEPFSRASFDAQMKIDSVLEFFHNILAIKFFFAEIDKQTYDETQMQEVVIFSDINEQGYDKWYNIVLTYVKQGWI